MKRKIFASIIILIVSIVCCGCNIMSEQDYNSDNQSYGESYNDSSEPIRADDDLTPVVYITRYGIRYHRFGCSHAKNLYIKLTVRQAISKGYTACYFCCY